MRNESRNRNVEKPSSRVRDISITFSDMAYLTSRKKDESDFRYNQRLYRNIEERKSFMACGDKQHLIANERERLLRGEKVLKKSKDHINSNFFNWIRRLKRKS